MSSEGYAGGEEGRKEGGGEGCWVGGSGVG